MYKKFDYITDWEELLEGSNVHVYGDALVWWVSCSKPTHEEIMKFETSPIEFGIAEEQGILIFGYKTKNHPWLFVHYNYYNDKLRGELGEKCFKEPTIDSSTKPLLLKLYMSNIDTKQIVAKRVFELPDTMKEKVIEAIHIQKTFSVPIIQSLEPKDKISFFMHLRDFYELQDTNIIVKAMERKIFT